MNSYLVMWRENGKVCRTPFTTRLGAERYARYLGFRGLFGSVIVQGEVML